MTWIVAALVGIPLWVWAASWLGNSKQAERMADRMVEGVVMLVALPAALWVWLRSDRGEHDEHKVIPFDRHARTMLGASNALRRP